jgi:predicted nucleotidyltransferase
MDVTFDRDAIIAALTELADELVRSGTQIQIRVVGGAAISVAFDRETTTTDVDALYGANPDVETAARTIAYRNGWPENWLNDNVKQFASHFDTAGDQLQEEWTLLHVLAEPAATSPAHAAR